MNVLVTGANGFVGPHLISSLVRDGHRVKALVRNMDVDPALRMDGVDVIRGDLIDERSIRNAAESCEVIYHLARAKPKALPPRSAYQRDNVDGTRNLLRAALDAGVRHVVVCSSAAVFGRSDQIPIAADLPCKPVTLHDQTMLQRENIIRNAAAEGKISAIVARLSLILGPGALHILTMFRKIARRRYVLLGPADVYYQVTDVEDIVRGLKLCGARRDAAGDRYIIASDTAERLSRFVELVAEAAGVEFRPFRLPLAPFEVVAAVAQTAFAPFGREPKIMHQVESFKRQRFYDISKAKLELGFSPRVSLRETIDRTLSWYRTHGYF